MMVALGAVPSALVPAAEAFAAIDANMVVGRVERVEVTPRRGRRVRLSDHMGLAKREGGDVSY